MKKIIFSILISIGFLNFSANAADRYWIASATANWNSTSNWSTTSGGAGGASVPGSSDRAIFNSGGLGRCNINANASVLHIDVRNSYTDTIVQQSTNTITIASNGSFAVSGGVFAGGSGNITNNGSFTLDSNALFTSTAGTFAIRDAVTIDDGDDFTHNNGELSLTSLAAGSTINVDFDTITLYNFKINDNAGLKNITLASDNEITVNNNFTLTGSTSSYEIFLFGGKIFCKKNVYVSYRWSHTAGQGTTEVIIDGSGTQIVDGTGNNSGALFKLTINKSSSDTLKFKGPVVIQNNLTYQSGVVVFESSSEITCYFDFTIDGNFNFNKLTFDAVNINSEVTWNINDTLTVNDDLTFKGNAVVYLLGGIINCNGDFDVSSNTTANGTSTHSTYIGTTTIYLNSDDNQSWIGRSSASFTWLPIVVIDKPDGTLSISNHITIGNRLHYIQGDINPGSSTVAFVKTCDITGNNFSLYNVTLKSVAGYGSAIGLNDSTLLTINGTFATSGGSGAYFSSGTIHCKGNITVSNTSTSLANSYKIIINGTGNQTLTGNNNDNTGFLHNVEINKSSGTLYLKDLFSVTGMWHYKNGTIDATTNGSTIFFNLNFSPTIKGNHTLNKMQIYNNASSKKLIVANGTTITLESEFKTLSNGTNVIDTGTVEVKGNIDVSSGCQNGGTGTVKAIGTANQTFTGTTSLTTGELPNFTMNKSSGTFTVTNYLNVAKTLTLTNGVITTANGSSLVHLIDNATLSGGSTSSYVNGIVSKLGNDAFTFPLGENGLYRPLTITAPSSTSDRFTSEYFNSAQALGTSFDTAYAEISTNEYWALTRAVGSSTVKATMAWSANKFDIPCDENEMGSLYWTGSTWSGLTTDLFTGNASAGSLRTATLSSYSYLIFGKKKKNKYFVLTKHQLDGGVYLTKSNRLYVKYNGEYNLSELRFNIYNMSNAIVADQTDVGVVDKFYQTEGDNRFIFNFSSSGFSISSGYYILEIINDKNEKEYLRFQKL